MKRLSLLLIFISATVFAVGPKVPFLLTFTPSPTTDVTGYYFYWRTPTGAYQDSQRLAIATNAYTGFDLRVLGLAKGTYMVAMTATNIFGESDLSVEATWNYSNPTKPSDVKVQ